MIKSFAAKMLEFAELQRQDRKRLCEGKHEMFHGGKATSLSSVK